MRILPSWHPVAANVGLGSKATQSTMFGCGKFMAGLREASFQTCTALSGPALQMVALSAAMLRSCGTSAGVKVCTLLRNSGVGSCPGWKGTLQERIVLSPQLARRTRLLGVKARLWTAAP